MRMLWDLIRAYPRRSALMFLSLLLAGVSEGLGLTTLLPLLAAAVGQANQSGLGRKAEAAMYALGIEPTITTMLVIIQVGMVLKSILVLLAKRQVGYTVAHAATDLRLAMISALLGSRWTYYLRQPAGALANSVAVEAYRAATGFEYGANAVALLIQVLIYTTLSLLVSWQAALATLTIGALFVFALNRFVRKARRAGGKQTHLMRTLVSYLADVLVSVKPLKAMARENMAGALLREDTQKLNRAMRREVMSKETLRALQEPMLATLAVVGMYFALVRWHLSLPSVMVMAFLVARNLGALNRAQQVYQQLVLQESAYGSLRAAIADAQAAAEHSAGAKVPTLEKEVRFENVRFGYGAHPVLDGLDLAIPAGGFIAVTGASGAGKSTLMDLLCALMDTDAGEIRVDGVPLSELDRRRWRHMIGYVPQETVLLHDTIMNNVLVGEPELGAADAESALRQAGLWDFVSSLPEGMNTVVGERGGRLSGGQRQRVAIARAIAHRPKLLILDEATTALDPATEAKICETIRALKGKLTVVAVSHQPALVNAADRVYHLAGGRALPVADAAVAGLKA